MRKLFCAAVLTALGAPCAQAQITSLDLANYQVSGNYALNLSNNGEVSGVTWSRDTGRLYTIEDEGQTLYELSTTGTQISKMSLSGFEDTEGITYIGGGQFVITEEREQDLYRLTYTAGATVFKSTLPRVDIGATTGNNGLEGVSYDPRTGKFVTVKEYQPQLIQESTVTWGTYGSPGSAASMDLFSDTAIPSSLGVVDLSDVQVLATVPSLLGGVDENNLLVVSQESMRLLEITRSGEVLSFFNLPAGFQSTEGVTIDDAGNIYLVNESTSDGPARLLVLSPQPVPLPAAAWLLISGLGALGAAGRRRRLFA